MASGIYNNYKEELLKGTIDHDSNTFKVALLDSGHTPDFDAHDNFDDVSGDEISGDGYTAGGATLSGLVISQDNTDNEGVWDANDVTWPASTLIARYAVVYKDSGSPSTSPLICLIDFGGDEESDNGDFEIAWNAEGIVNIG